MSGDTENQNSRTRTDSASTQTVTTPGTGFGQNILTGIENSGLLNQIGQNTQGYQGDLTNQNQPVLDDYVGTWGTAPNTFITQQTAGPAPYDIDETYLDTHYDPGIEAGLNAASNMSGNLSGLTLAGLNRWNDIINGQQNPWMTQMTNQIQIEHAEGAAANQNALAATMGQQGAFGGSDYGRSSAWMAEQQQQELDQAITNMMYQDYYNNQQMLLQAPQGIAGFTGVGNLTAENMLRYGGMRNQNAQERQAFADTNAQGQANNAWNQARLTDENAQREADNNIAAWEAAHRVAQGDAANAVAQQGVRNQNEQARLDNDYARWAGNGETLQNQLNQLQQLVQIGASVPGMQSDSRGASRNITQGETSQSEGAWSIVSGIIGAIMQGYGSGMFSGGGGG